MARLFWLSDEAWATIAPHRPRGLPGKPRVDDRRVISGILHVLKVGCRWRDCPAECGPPMTIYNPFHRWAQRGRWQHLFAQVAASGTVPDELSLDSTHVKARRSAAGGNPRNPFSSHQYGRRLNHDEAARASGFFCSLLGPRVSIRHTPALLRHTSVPC